MPTGNNETQREYLHRQISDRLTRAKSSIEWYRHRHYRYQSSAVVLGALITILSGLKLPLFHALTPEVVASTLSDIVLILGAVSTVLAAFGSFFSPQQSWYLNAELYAKLRALQAQMEMAERSPTFSQREDYAMTMFFNEYQTIMDEHNKKWQDIRQKSR